MAWDTIYNWVRGSNIALSNHSNLVQRCKDWLTRDWEVNLRCISREANEAADHLAKSALPLRHGERIEILIPSEDLLDIIHADAYGSLSQRIHNHSLTVYLGYPPSSPNKK